MKYNFIALNGAIIETDNLSTIKEGLTWERLNHLRPEWNITKEEKAFLDKYKLYCSVWNVAVLQHLKMVYLFSTDYKRLKGGKQ